MASIDIFKVFVKTFASMLNYCSRSEVALSTIIEKPAQSSKSTPSLSKSTVVTLSTTSLANDPSYSSSWTIDDTLSMITTPWTTESWTTVTSSDDLLWNQSEEPSTAPRTSTSYGVSTLLDSLSQTTLTLCSFQEIDADSHSIHPLNSNGASELSSTFSSWTIESFTSSGWLSDISSKLLRVNYPWSPYTETNYTDSYPSSLLTKSGFSIPSSTTLNNDFDYLTGLDMSNEDYSVLVT